MIPWFHGLHLNTNLFSIKSKQPKILINKKLKKIMNQTIYRWIKQGLIKPEQRQQALQLVDERPTASAWLSFNRELLLLLGLLSLAFGVVFFFAFNWNELSRMFKFMTLQLLLVGLFVGYYFKSKSFWVSQALLLAAVIVLGALLALFGQTYQTGADPWQLFATWAMLISPLVIFSRSEVLWLVWAVLINTALSLYLSINHSLLGWVLLSHHWPWLFLLVNSIMLVMLEWLSSQSNIVSNKVFKQVKLSHRWAAQVLGLYVLFILAVIGMDAIWGYSDRRSVNGLLFGLMMSLTFLYYRYKVKDLLLLTAWVLSLIVFVLAVLAKFVFRDFDAGGLLLMAICLIGMTTFAVRWIKQTHELFQAEKQS